MAGVVIFVHTRAIRAISGSSHKGCPAHPRRAALRAAQQRERLPHPGPRAVAIREIGHRYLAFMAAGAGDGQPRQPQRFQAATPNIKRQGPGSGLHSRKRGRLARL